MRASGRDTAISFRRAAMLATSALVLVASACKDRPKQEGADSELSRDLQLASQVGAQATPTLQDTAVATRPAVQPQREQPAPTPKPVRTARSESPRRAPAPVAVAPEPQRTPAPAPAPAAPATGQIAAGTGLSLSSNSRVCTSTSRPGDKIVGTVRAPITGSNGAVIPAGSKVVLEVASVSPPSSSDAGQIAFRVVSLYMDDVSHPLSGDVATTASLERVKEAGSSSGDKTKVIGGAVAGAILGQILGHSTKSTVIGAATGAAAGAVAAKASERYESCLPEGAELHLTLSEPVVLRTASN